MDPRTTFGTATRPDRRARRNRLPRRRRPRHHRPGSSLRLGRPLLLEGEPGTGKTALAEALAETLDLPLIRLQCYEGIDATQALYDWDFPRQILHLRALEAAERRRARRARGRAGPVRRALPHRPADAAGAARRPCRAAHRRDRPGRRRVRGVPARGALDLAGDHPRARHRHGTVPADRRADLQPHPRGARRAQAALPLPLGRAPRPRARGRDRASRGCRRCRPRWPSRWCGAVHGSAPTARLLKPPGVAETLDWARALHELGARELDAETRGGHARRGGEVPRGRRAGQARRST